MAWGVAVRHVAVRHVAVRHVAVRHVAVRHVAVRLHLRARKQRLNNKRSVIYMVHIPILRHSPTRLRVSAVAAVPLQVTIL